MFLNLERTQVRDICFSDHLLSECEIEKIQVLKDAHDIFLLDR